MNARCQQDEVRGQPGECCGPPAPLRLFEGVPAFLFKQRKKILNLRVRIGVISFSQKKVGNRQVCRLTLLVVSGPSHLSVTTVSTGLYWKWLAAPGEGRVVAQTRMTGETKEVRGPRG